MVKKSKSIREHLLVPILIIMLLQAVLFLSTILYGGAAKSLKSNAVDILSENTRSGKLYMEKEIVHRWMNEVENAEGLSEKIESILDENGFRAEEIRHDPQVNKQIMDEIMPYLIDLLHRSYATGAFLVLDGPAAANSAEGTKAGAYIRDLDISNYAQDNSDLLLERGLPSLASAYGIALDSFWELGFTLNENEGQNNYFYKPFRSAVENQARENEENNYGYMSRPFSLHPLDTKVISYSVPIIINDTDVIGVIGLDLTVVQLKNYMSADKQDQSNSEFNLLGVRVEGEDEVSGFVTTGPLFKRFFGEADSVQITYDQEYKIYRLVSLDGTEWLASPQTLDIYNHNTPFEQEEWVYMKVEKEQDVFSFYQKIRTMMTISLLLPLIFSWVCVVISARVLTDPIQKLVAEIRDKKNLDHLSLKKVNIEEIDQLTDAIEELSKDVAENASKISNILDHANVPIGVFEYREKLKNIFCSKSLFEMLGWGELEGNYVYLDAETFRRKFEALGSPIDENGIFCVYGTTTRWYKLLGVQQEDNYLGVVSDVTADMLERRKLERERDYDLLTNLLNRRAFREHTTAAMNADVGVSAMIMWDLDNLKYINDTYGHDEGDRYIVLFARQLARLEEKGGLISRYAGDEFLTFLYSDDGKEEIRKRLASFMESLRRCTMEMEEGYRIPLRVSAGVAWYPDDTQKYEKLISYADFAMYTAKHSVKGILLEFNKESYKENSYLLAGKEELNRIFEERCVKFAYQPIVDRKGNIYGYELLMRPKMEKLRGINEVLNLAKAQAKLSQMESLTWNVGLESASHMLKDGKISPDVRIFINSIANVHMTDLEVELIEQRYGEFLHSVVIELTESEPMMKDCLDHKTSAASRWKAQIAIDDYGSGYSSEAVLLQIKPDIVKLDMSLVRNINSDEKRQMLVKNVIDYARSNSITVLAEGVETYEELSILMNFKVELFQGYYIGRPDEEVRPLDPYIIERIRLLDES